jgi:hypothetical protein
VALPRQEADFTAEGAPPPGRVGLEAPEHLGPQAAGRISVAPEAGKVDRQDAVRRTARVVGEVSTRQGDGVNIVVPPGPCVVRLTALDATLSWGEEGGQGAGEGEVHGVVAMPLTDFQRLLQAGAIVFDDEAPR